VGSGGGAFGSNSRITASQVRMRSPYTDPSESPHNVTSLNGVLMSPGSIKLTDTPLPWSSLRRLSVSASTAALLAE
jgi:hypothetical protein